MLRWLSVCPLTATLGDELTYVVGKYRYASSLSMDLGVSGILGELRSSPQSER